MYDFIWFPNSDSELKGSTRGQKIGTRITTGVVARADLVVPAGFVFAVYMQRSCMVPSPLCSRMATFEIYYSKYQWKIVSIAFRPIHLSTFLGKSHSAQYVYRYFRWFSLFSPPGPPWPRIGWCAENSFLDEKAWPRQKICFYQISFF